MMKVYVVVFLQFLFLSITNAQDDPIEQSANILPPSPTASELGKYGLVPLGLNTGTPNINLPLHDFVVRSLSVPISLSYYSNGMKVDQIASWVGLGWSLNAGGVITRTVRDEADEEASPDPYPEVMNVTNIEAAKYIELAANDGFDSEADLYSFNFLNYSGKFVFDRNGNPIMVPFQNIKIERHLSGGFVITTPEGLIFTFAETESTRTMNITPGCGKNYDVPAVTAWYLTTIDNQRGDVIHLEYKSNTYPYKSSVSQVMMKSLGPGTCPGETGACPGYTNQTCITQLTVIGKTLSRIYSTNYGEIEFVSTKSRPDVDDFRLDAIIVKNAAGQQLKKIAFNYINSNSGSSFTHSLITSELKVRMFLQSIDEHDASNSKIRSHNFEYDDINGLPPRLSFAQDHWGFFNGVDNDYLVPTYQAAKDVNGNMLFPDVVGDREPNAAFAKKGILKKITYPTGGYTELDYEANTYWGTMVQYPPKTSVNLGTTGMEDRIIVTEQYSISPIQIQQDVFVTAAAVFNTNSTYPVDDIHNVATVKIYDETSSIYVVNKTMKIGEHYQDWIELFTGHSYKVTLTACGEVTGGSVQFQYYATGRTETTTNVPTGGVRIKKTVSTDVVETKSEQTNYVYAPINNISKSSGKPGKTPQYYSLITSRLPCGGACGFYDCVSGSLYSNSQIPLSPVNGNHIYYQYVTVYKGAESTYANGAEEHEFKIQFDEPGYIVIGEHIKNAPQTNFGWGNGLEQAVRTYAYRNNEFKIQKETINNYDVDSRYNNAVASLTVRKKYSPICSSDVVVDCDASNVNKVTTKRTCTANHQHHWVYGGWPLMYENFKCTSSGANMENVVVWHHPCFGKTPGESVIVISAISHLDAIEYKTIAYWFYNKSTIEKLYDKNGANPVTTQTQFIYDNPQHGFLTRTIVTDSKNIDHQTTHWYPQDYASPGNLNTLRTKNMLSIPIKTEVKVGTNLVSGTVIDYTDNGLPANFYKYRSDQLTAPVNHDPTKILPGSEYEPIGSLTYSSSNNLTQVTSESAPMVSYLYDYFDSKPVAKVTNASASEIAYCSFESNGKGNWSFNGPPSNDLTCRTGDYYYKLAGGNITTTVTPGKYLLQFWAKGVVNVTGATLIAKHIADRNGWELYDYRIETSTTATLIISGGATAYVDELRLHPVQAEMSTYTYKDGIRLSSQTDSGNVTTRYEYDLFGRLQVVKDNDGNIVNTYQYKYRTPE